MVDLDISTHKDKVRKWKESIERKIDSEIHKHNLDPDAHDELFDAKSTVTFSRSLHSGTEIGSITIDGTTTKLYCETDTDTTYGIADSNNNGLMSRLDKNKLDGISDSADAVSMTATLTTGTKLGTIFINGVGTDLYCETNTDTIYTHPTYANAPQSSSGLYKLKINNQGHVIESTAVTKGDITALGIPSTNTTYGADRGISNVDGKFGHSNTSITAQATKALKKITYDIYGHITGSSDVTKDDITALGIPAQDTTYNNATTTANGLMSKDDKAKLDGITASADAVSVNRSLSSGTKIATITINGVGTDLYCEPDTDTVYTHPTYTARTGKPTTNQTPGFGDSVTVSQITSDGTGHVTAANDKTIKIPDAEATGTTHGLMSATDKAKLNGIESEANKYVHPSGTAKTGNPTANQTPGFGSTFTVTQFTSNDTGHISGATDRTVKIPNSTATQSAAGLMSADDKKKLDGVATSANNYTHPSGTAKTGNPTANQTPGFGDSVTVTQFTSNATGHISGATDRTITIPSDVATTTTAGLMSKDDKSKLNNIAAGANAYTHPNSGVTAGTHVNNNQEPAFNNTFNIPKITYNAQGHITNMSSATVKIPALPTASTSAAGIVQLNDSTNNTSTTQAATANAVKKAYDLANGKANSVHTHHDTDLDWNGVNEVNAVSPLDMALYGEFNANRLAFYPGDYITVEYSTDNGLTWTEIGTAAEKTKLVTTAQNFYAGNQNTTDCSKNQLRVTIKMGDKSANSKLYMVTRKLMIYFATAHATGTKVQLSYSTYANPTTFINIGTSYDVGGWTGWNTIPLNVTLGGFANQVGNDSTRIQNLRLTFTQTGGTDNCYVTKIRLFGETAWSQPSTMARTDHLYEYDESGNATFPNTISANKFIRYNGTSSQFLKADGSVDSTTYVATTDSRLSDNRTPSSHAHGNITNEGTIGSNANRPLITTANGKITTGEFGSSTTTTANYFVACNDQRLSDTRTPSDGTVTTSKIVNKNVTLEKLNNNVIIPEYIVGTQTTSTSAWTGKSTHITSLNVGQVIWYKLPYASTTTAVTLNLTLADGSTTGAKEVWFWNGTRATNNYGVNSVIGLVYNGTQWWVINPSSNNNNNSNLYGGVRIKAGEAIAANTLIFGKKNGLYYKLAPNVVLDIRYPVVYITSAVDANGINTGNYWVHWNPSTANNGFTSWTVPNMVYIEGTSYENGQFTVSSTGLTQTLTNGKYYIVLGEAETASAIKLRALNLRVFHYEDDVLVPVTDEYYKDNGGRNLIPSSQAFNNANGVLTGGTYKGCSIRRYNNTSGTNYVDCQWNHMPENGEFNAGDYFTLSFWAKGTGNIICYNYGQTGYMRAKPVNATDGAVYSGYGDGNCTFTLTQDWKRYFVTWKLDSASTATDIVKYLLIRTLKGTDAYYAGPMFEKGRIAHDWSPNPDDKADIGQIPMIQLGTSDGVAFTNAENPPITRYYHGLTIHGLNWGQDNKVNATLNINSLGAKPIFYKGRAIQAGEFPNKSVCTFVYANYNAFNSNNGVWILVDDYLIDGSVTSAKIADGTIVNGDIANTTIQGGKLVNGTITATQLASNAVETAKIKDNAVTPAKLGTFEYISSTHESSTSAWTGTSTRISSLVAGTVIYYKLRQDPTTTAVTLALKLNTGTTVTNNVYYDGNRLTNQYKKNQLIPLFFDGGNWVVISPYTDTNTNTTYTADNSTIELSGTQFKVKDSGITSAKIADGTIVNTDIADETLEMKKFSVHAYAGTSGTAGYVKLLKFTITGSYQDRPIEFDIERRHASELVHCSVTFKGASDANPGLSSFMCSNEIGFQGNAQNKELYLYKEDTSVWSLIVRKSENYDTPKLTRLYNPNSNITVEKIKEFITSLPTETSTNPLNEIASINSIIEYIEGTHGTTATGTWTGVSKKIMSLTKGNTIYFKMTSAGSGNATLNLTLPDGTTTGAKEVWYNATTRFTTHLPVNTVLNLVYDGSKWINTAIQNTNNFERLYANGQIINGDSAQIPAYTLVWGKKDTKYYKVAAGQTFNTRYPLFFLNGALNSGAGTNNVYHFAFWVNLQYTVSGLTVTTNKMVYVEGTEYTNDGEFTVSSRVFVSEDNLQTGCYYKPIGMSYSVKEVRFEGASRHDIYYYDGVNLRPANLSPTFGYLDDDFVVHGIYGDLGVVSSTNIIQSGDNVKLYLAKNPDSAISTADLYKGSTKLTTVTFSNDEASYTYSGTGAGKQEFKLVSGSLVSESYEVIDALVYDKGLSGDGNHNDSAWESITGFTEFTRGSDGTTVTNNTGSNKTLIADITSGGSYDFTPPFRIEFNFEKLNSGDTNTALQIFDSSNNYFNPWVTQTGHYIIDVKSDKVEWSINGTPQTGKTVTFGNVFIRFLLSNGVSMKFSEFKVYPI